MALGFMVSVFGCTLKMIVAYASVQVTGALVVADDAQATPVADDPYFLKPLSLRTSGTRYISASAPNAWLVGLEFAKTVIPDQALEKLPVGEIVEYWRKSADVYQAWASELNQMAAKIDDLTVDEARDRIPKMIATELEPRLVAYKAEMTSVRIPCSGIL